MKQHADSYTSWDLGSKGIARVYILMGMRGKIWWQTDKGSLTSCLDPKSEHTKVQMFCVREKNLYLECTMMRPPFTPTHTKCFTGLMTQTLHYGESHLGQAIMVSDYIDELGGFLTMDKFKAREYVKHSREGYFTKQGICGASFEGCSDRDVHF